MSEPYLATDEQLALYPREVAAAAEMGLHPHEAIPRTGPTFLHERQQWEKEVERIRERDRNSTEVERAAWALVKGLWGTVYLSVDRQETVEPLAAALERLLRERGHE